MIRSARPALLAALPLALLAGCKPNNSKVPDVNNANIAQPAHGPGGSPVDPAITTTLSGTIHFDGKAPERVRIDMSQDPACAMTGGDNFSEQYVVDHGNLANVYVFVKNGPAVAMNAAPAGNVAPVVLDQKGCRYIPHVIAVEHDEPVEFRNSDPTMHNVHTMPTTSNNQTVDISEGPSSQPQIRTFNTPEVMMPVRCNNHPWMNAFINVAPTPFFAVSSTDGKFTIPNLPAGAYTIAAVQEKLGEQDQQITVQAKTPATLNFTFKAAAAH